MARADEPHATDEASEVAPAGRAPTKTVKKKGRARREAAASSSSPPAKGASGPKAARAPLPGAGTPEGDKLREAFRAFDVGDYARVRVGVRELERAASPPVRAAAADLAARIAVDPLQVVVILACAAVFAAIVYAWVL